jgi:hypothetical protein
MARKVIRFSRTSVSLSSEVVIFPSIRGSLQSGGIPSVREIIGDTMASSAVRLIITRPKCVFFGMRGTCSLNALSSASST